MESFNRNSMSLGLVLLERLFTHTQTLQSDAMTADIKIHFDPQSIKSVGISF